MTVDHALLRRARLAAGLTQADVARALGVRELTVGAWERGVERPRVQHLPQLSAVLGVPDLIPADVGNPIWRGRMRAGLTTAQAAAAAGIGQGAWSRIERGLGGMPRTDVMESIAAALDVPPEEVFEWSERTFTPPKS